MMTRSRALAALLLTWSVSTAHAQLVGRLVDAIDVTARQNNVDISLIFGCGLRYVSHSPASEGDVLRVHLKPLPDCGDLSGALIGVPPPLNGVSLIRGIEIDQLAAGAIDITLRFDGAKLFVLAPTGDSHGLRIRLLGAELDRARVFIGEPTGPPATYAVNLDSAQQPFEQAALDEATRVTGVSAYSSEILLGDQKWYRLRIGPFATEAAARKNMNLARTRYPKAWLAIGDDAELTSPNGKAVEPSLQPTLPKPAPTLTLQDIDETFSKAKKAFNRKDYDTAIPLLTRLLEQPEFPKRADAQELMGLARERNRQLAHAKAEYEEYLRRYPKGRGVKRVQERLRALELATRPSRNGMGVAAEESAWRVYGGFSQLYRRDQSKFENAALSTNFTSQNALLNDVDVVARRRGERYDLSMRASAGYQKDLLSDGPGDQTRVSIAFVEFGDRELDWSMRAGRQTRNTDGLFGTFDGLAGGYQLRPLLRLNAAFGFPVETSTDSLDTSRKFAGLSANFGTFADAWDISLYALEQRLEGNVDRRIIGTEIQYFRPGRTLVLLAEHDIEFQELNHALLLATLELPGRFTLGANLDHRKSPSLSLRNALIGQPVTEFDDLFSLFTMNEIAQLALDRSADADVYSLSLSRPFGEHWQWSLDFSRYVAGGTPASGGVEAVPDAGADTTIALRGIASSIFGGNDLSMIELVTQSSPTVETRSVGLSTRFPLWGAWRLGPRARVDEREFATDGSTQRLYVPSLRLDWLSKRVLFELETGAEIGQRELGAAQEDTTRYYLSVGYRMNF
jgi:tetratricopeptide (TPR) repeat protein